MKKNVVILCLFAVMIISANLLYAENDLKENISSIYQNLKKFYISQDKDVRADQVKQVEDMVERYGYLPVPFHLAQDLSNQAIFTGLECIWTKQGIFKDGQFLFQHKKDMVPAFRMGYDDPSWIIREQHKIESISLMGLTEKKGDTVCGCFRNLLIKILTSAAGVPADKIPATTFYLLPPYHRDGAFNSAFCPISSEIAPQLEDNALREELKLSADDQIRVFILLANLAGHPVVVDLLPQAGRFSKTVFTYPDCFRWMYVPDVIASIGGNIPQIVGKIEMESTPTLEKSRFLTIMAMMDDTVGKSLQIVKNAEKSDSEEMEANLRAGVRTLYHELYTQILKEEKKKEGGWLGFASDKLEQEILRRISALKSESILERFGLQTQDFPVFCETLTLFCKSDFALQPLRRNITNEHLSQANQSKVVETVRRHIQEKAGKLFTDETEITAAMHLDLLNLLKGKGFWTVQGGCWNSVGHPIFHRMSPGQDEYAYPMSDHYSCKDLLVNAFSGDMDIITPWYFAFLEKASEPNNLNRFVISKYIAYCTGIYQKYRPNGFRIDHLDHSADYPISINDAGNSISYRAPLVVFKELGNEIRSRFDSTFALFAEYMGWGDSRGPHLYKAYHENGIQLSISTDIVGEFWRNAYGMIAQGNELLEKYNEQYGKESHFSCTRILDNHDRSHPDIGISLSEFTKERAMLKWMKCLFLPGGKLAECPVFYIDGNDTNTPNIAFAKTFLGLQPLARGKDTCHFARFDSLLRFSLQESALKHGQAFPIPLDKGKCLDLPYEFSPEGNISIKEKKNCYTSHNTLSAWLVWPLGSNKSQPLLVVAHEFINEKEPDISDVPAFEIVLPKGYDVINEIVLPEPKSCPETLEGFLSQTPKISEIPWKPTEDSKYLENKDGCYVLWVKPLSANQFRIFRLFKYS